MAMQLRMSQNVESVSLLICAGHIGRHASPIMLKYQCAVTAKACDAYAKMMIKDTYMMQPGAKGV